MPGQPAGALAGGWRRTRPLWIGLGVLMVASPLGLLAAGSAWGEWGLDDLQNSEVREQIAHASGDIAFPEQIPQGLQQLSGLWTAPMPDYAPAFMHSANFGYVMSAILGTGLIILVFTGLSWISCRLSASRSRPV
jgi:cobalt/nickel transport system permease protein